MKLIKKTLIATAVASALLANTSAMAKWVNGPTAIKTVIKQSVSPNPVVATDVDANDSAVVDAGHVGDSKFTLSDGSVTPTQALTVNDQIIFSLTGGAKFKGLPILSSSVVANANSFDGFFEADGVTPAVGSGPVIRFHMTDGLAVAGTSLYLNTSANIFDVSNVTVGTNVDLTLTTKNVVGSIINAINNESLATDLPGPPATFLFNVNNLLSCTGLAVVSKTDTADVTDNFRSFVPLSTPGVADGNFLTYAATNNASSPAVPVAATKILYKLVGDFNGIASITGAGITGTDSTGTVVGTFGQFTINALKTEAYAYNTSALAGGLALDILPQFHLPTGAAKTAQSARSFALTTSVLADTTNGWSAHNVSCDAASYTIVRNGSSFVINFFGSANRLRITDVSGSILSGTGKINITAFNQQGVAVPLASGSTFAPAPLGPRETRIIVGADLLAAYPTATHFEFAVESPAIEAASLKFVNGAVTSSGVYTNKTAVGGI